MKAYQARAFNRDYSTVVFAETAGRAKEIAQGTDACDDAEFIDIRVRRLPKADSLYCGKSEADWWDAATRLLLVKEYGWQCLDAEYDECEDCPAKDYCSEYEYLKDVMEERDKL